MRIFHSFSQITMQWTDWIKLYKTEPAICGWIHWGDPRSLAPSRSFPHANACENRRWRAFSMLIWVQKGSGRPRCSVWHSVTSVGGVQTGVEGCPKDLSNLFYFFPPPRLNLLLKLSASLRMFLRHYWQKPKGYFNAEIQKVLLPSSL